MELPTTMLALVDHYSEQFRQSFVEFVRSTPPTSTLNNVRRRQYPKSPAFLPNLRRKPPGALWNAFLQDFESFTRSSRVDSKDAVDYCFEYPPEIREIIYTTKRHRALNHSCGKCSIIHIEKRLLPTMRFTKCCIWDCSVHRKNGTARCRTG